MMGRWIGSKVAGPHAVDSAEAHGLDQRLINTQIKLIEYLLDIKRMCHWYYLILCGLRPSFRLSLFSKLHGKRVRNLLYFR